MNSRNTGALLGDPSTSLADTNYYDRPRKFSFTHNSNSNNTDNERLSGVGNGNDLDRIQTFQKAANVMIRTVW